MRSTICALILCLGTFVAGAQTAPASVPESDELKALRAELERLKVELELAQKRGEIAASSATLEFAELKARAEAEKALAEARKATNQAEIDKDWAAFSKLAGVDLSKVGKAGSYALADNLPTSMRATVEAERALVAAISGLCEGQAVKDQLRAGTTYFDPDGRLVQDAAAGLVLKKQLEAVKKDLDEIVPATAPSVGIQLDPGTALAAIQGLRLLSETSRLFRTDRSAVADSTQFDVDTTLGPLVEEHCGAGRLDKSTLVVRRVLDKSIENMANLQMAIRTNVAGARAIVAVLTAEQQKETDAARKRTWGGTIARYQGTIDQADALLKATEGQALVDVAWAEYVAELLNADAAAAPQCGADCQPKPGTAPARLLRVTAAGEAKRQLSSGAWRSAKAEAAGSAFVRATVRDAKSGRLLATGALFVACSPVDITRLAADSFALMGCAAPK